MSKELFEDLIKWRLYRLYIIYENEKNKMETFWAFEIL